MRFFPESDTGSELHYTPANIAAQISELTNQIVNLRAEIIRQIDVTDPDKRAFVESYARWSDGWLKFVEENPSSWWGSNLQIVEMYRANLVKYYDLFEKYGGKGNFPKPVANQGDTLDKLMPLLYVGLGVAGLWAISKIIGSVTGTGLLDKERR